MAIREQQLKKDQEEILKVEREMNIIGRYHSISMIQTFELKNVKAIIYASWVIYLKY